MALYELSDPAKRRVENGFLAVGLGTVLAWLVLAVVAPAAVALSTPAGLGVPALLWAAAALSVPSYPAVGAVRRQFADDPADGVTFEGALWAVSAVLFLLSVVVILFVLVVLSGAVP